MVQFVKFWLNCFLNGWSVAGGFFNITGTIALLGSFILISRRKYEHRKNWEESMLKVTGWVFLVSFLISTVFVAPFLQFKEVDTSRKRLSVENHSLVSKTNVLITKLNELSRNLEVETRIAQSKGQEILSPEAIERIKSKMDFLEVTRGVEITSSPGDRSMELAKVLVNLFREGGASATISGTSGRLAQTQGLHMIIHKAKRASPNLDGINQIFKELNQQTNFEVENDLQSGLGIEISVGHF